MMNMRRGLQNKAKKVAFGVGMGALLSIPVATMVTSTAGATGTSTCYPSCTAPSTGPGTGPSTGLPTTSGSSTAAVTTPASAAAPTGGLAFTGADLSELVIISVGALGAGTVLVRYSRRRQAA
jgi:hypothetical protein